MIHIKTTALIGFLVIVGSSLLFAAPALADIGTPPPDSVCSEFNQYDNHGSYVSCVAHHKELWGSNGNSDAGKSDTGKK